jgi:hypothetical protein
MGDENTIVLEDSRVFYAEGHTAHATKERSYRGNGKNDECTHADFAEDFMAIPVVSNGNRAICRSRRDLCIEALMQDGKRFKQNVSFRSELCKAFDVKLLMLRVNRNMFGELHGVFRRV